MSKGVRENVRKRGKGGKEREGGELASIPPYGPHSAPVQICVTGI